MKILVTGGAGFIGSNLADLLVEQGHEVAVLDNLFSGLREYLNPRAKFHEIDICDRDKVRKVFEVEKFDYVYHLAAQIDVRKSVEEPVFDNQVNAVGSYNIFETAADTGVKRVIFISTGGALYGDVTEPATEKTQVAPLSPYAIHKRYLALLHESRQLDYAVLRLANVYGPRQFKGGEAGVIAIFVDGALSGKHLMINGSGLQTRDYVYVGDVARACLLAMQSEQGGTYNIGAGKENTVLDLVASIELALDSKIDYEHGPAKVGEPMRSVLDWSKAEQELGWQPEVDLTEGIRRTIEWSKSRQRS
jgi:UDP-glucose 4-epimerase